MGLELIKVETAAQKNAFLKLPWEIYRNEPRWIPPLLQERKRFLSPKINPFFKHAEVIHYLAIGENRKPAGRITFILDHIQDTLVVPDAHTMQPMVTFIGETAMKTGDRVSTMDRNAVFWLISMRRRRQRPLHSM